MSRAVVPVHHIGHWFTGIQGSRGQGRIPQPWDANTHPGRDWSSQPVSRGIDEWSRGTQHSQPQVRRAWMRSGPSFVRSFAPWWSLFYELGVCYKVTADDDPPTIVMESPPHTGPFPGLLHDQKREREGMDWQIWGWQWSAFFFCVALFWVLQFLLTSFESLWLNYWLAGQ